MFRNWGNVRTEKTKIEIIKNKWGVVVGGGCVAHSVIIGMSSMGMCFLIMKRAGSFEDVHNITYL